MKLCECGCGKEVKNKFVSGHNSRVRSEELNEKFRQILRDNSRKGISPSEETRKKMSESAKNKPPISEETREKLRIALKNRPPISEETREKLRNGRKGKHHSEETKQKLREINLGKHPSEETREKLSKVHKGENHHNWKGGVSAKGIPLYETYSHQLIPVEEVRRIRFTELGQANMQVRCYNSSCRKWFYPNKNQVIKRVMVINGKMTGGYNFYCGDKCKQNCPTFNQIAYSKNEDKLLNRPYIDPWWREEVLRRDDYECQKCGTNEKIEAHHILSATLYPMFANDVDNGATFCHDCHMKDIHGQEGCRPSDFRC